MTSFDKAYKDARACLEDVVSHATNFRKGLEASKLRDLNSREHAEKGGEEFDDDTDDVVSYHKHEQAVLDRMVSQANVALQVLPETFGTLTIDQIADAASAFACHPVSRTLVLAVLHSTADLDIADITYESEGEQVVITRVLARLIKSMLMFLPLPKDTALTQVTIHGDNGNEAKSHINRLEKGIVFSWHHDPTTLYICNGTPFVDYTHEPMWCVKCDKIVPSNAS